MKLDTNFISRIKKDLSAQDENLRSKVYVFLICLAISVIIWFLITLSKESVSNLDYPVVFTNLPEDMTLVNKPDSILSFRISSGGFDLITLKYLTRKQPIVIDISNIKLKKDGDYFTGTYSTADISASFFKEHNFAEGVVSYSPQFIQFNFEPLLWKKVPVVLGSQPSFAPQYRIKGTVRLVPDSVKIIGQQDVLNQIEIISTSERNMDNISTLMDYTLDLVNPEPETKLHISPKQVHAFIDVERFTESSIEVPVQVKQKDIEVKLFPSTVKITFLVGLDDFNRISAESFKAVIDLTQNPAETKVKVYLEQKPEFIDITRIEPEKLEYLIIKKL